MDKQYAIIPMDLMCDDSINNSAKLFYGHVSSLAHKTGYCWASNKYFEDVFNKSTNTITNWVNGLRDAGYIEVSYLSGKDGLNRKRKIFITDSNEITVEPVPKNCEDSSQKTGTLIPKNWERNTITNNTSNILSKDSSKKPKIIDPMSDLRKKVQSKKKPNLGKGCYSLINSFTANYNLQELLKEYFQIRVRRNLSITQWSIILDDIITVHGNDIPSMVRSVRNAIAGGYHTIIPKWELEQKLAPGKGKQAFDNTSAHTPRQHDPNKDELATDDEGNVIQF